jgi:hypothetical protein
MIHRIKALYELRVPIAISAVLVLYGLTNLPLSRFVALVALVPFLYGWKLMVQNYLTAELETAQSVQVALPKNKSHHQDVYMQFLETYAQSYRQLEQKHQRTVKQLAVLDQECKMLHQQVREHHAELRLKRE